MKSTWWCNNQISIAPYASYRGADERELIRCWWWFEQWRRQHRGGCCGRTGVLADRIPSTTESVGDGRRGCGQVVDHTSTDRTRSTHRRHRHRRSSRTLCCGNCELRILLRYVKLSACIVVYMFIGKSQTMTLGKHLIRIKESSRPSQWKVKVRTLNIALFVVNHHCCPVSEMTYTVSSGTLNSTIPYHTTAEALRYGMSCSRGIKQFYLHTHTFIRNRSEPYLPLLSQPQLVLIYRSRRDGRLSRPWCEVAPAEIRTCNLPIANPRHSTTQPLAHRTVVCIFPNSYLFSVVALQYAYDIIALWGDLT